MSLPVAIPDYAVYNKPPYLLQFMVGGDMEALVHILDRQYNDLETAMWGVLNSLWPTSASGVQLDALGVHLNLARNGREDASYATLLKIAGLIYLSSGQPDVLINAIKSLYGATSVVYTPTYPMKIAIVQNGALALFVIDTYLLENGDNYTLENGDNFTFNIEDITAANLLAGAVPSGVQLTVTKA